MNLSDTQSFKDDTIRETINKCPIRFTINMIGGKWKLLILWELHTSKAVRFNELKRSIYGITNTMLSKSLEEMQSHDLVNRTQYNEMPLRVEYSLTAKGKSLIPILMELSEWGTKQINV